MTKPIMSRPATHGAEGKQEVDVERTGVGLGRNDRRMLELEEDRETNIASFPSPHPNRGRRGPTHSTQPGQQASRPDRYIDEVYR